MRHLLIKTILVLLAGTLLCSCAELGIEIPGAGNPGVGAGPAGPAASTTISAGEARRIARELGLTGYKPLPPGIARNLAKGKRLPPGIAKRYPPQSMLGRLPKIADHEWRIAGRDLILVAIGTAIVVDILDDVFD